MGTMRTATQCAGDPGSKVIKDAKFWSVYEVKGCGGDRVALQKAP